MEHIERASVIPMDPSWNDLSNCPAWSAGAKHTGQCTDGDVISQNSNNNHIKGGDRLVAAIGVENLVLVDTSDAPLVTQSNHVEQVKLMIALKLSIPGSLSPLE